MLAGAIDELPGRMMAAPIESGEIFSYGRPQMLFDKTYSQPTAGWTYDVAPDDRFLMLKSAADAASTAAPISLVVVQHLDEELKRLVPVN
jgi:hypothetical protein